jgi:hypothetical protein
MTNITIVIISFFIILFAHKHAKIMKAIEENQKDREQYMEEMKKISRSLK